MMTIDEAINTINIAIAEVEWAYPMEYAIAFEMAIEASKNAKTSGRRNFELAQRLRKQS